MRFLQARSLVTVLIILTIAICLQIVPITWLYQSGQSTSWQKSSCELTGCTYLGLILVGSQNRSRYALIFSHTFGNSLIYASECLTVASNNTLCTDAMPNNITCFYQNYNPAQTLTLDSPYSRSWLVPIFLLTVLSLLTATWFIVLGFLFNQSYQPSYTEINT
jgi:hypothetical protein